MINTEFNTILELLEVFLDEQNSISSIQRSKDICVTQKTAWFMLHGIRNCFDFDNDNHNRNDISGEVDETYVGGKAKNKHRSRHVKGAQGRSTKGKAPVLRMVQLGGKVNAKHVEGRAGFI